MKKLLALLPLLVASASATPCTSTQYDMLSWFAMGQPGARNTTSWQRFG